MRLREEDSNIQGLNRYRWDDAVGMYYLNARYYSPETMRFISEDPDASSVNLYTYADDNPVNEVDPSGEFVEAIALFFIPGIGEVAAVSLAAALTIATGIYVYERVHSYYHASRSANPPAKRKGYNSRKSAHESAKRAGKGREPINHSTGKYGPHYHPDVPMPKNRTPKAPNPHDHYYYPR